MTQGLTKAEQLAFSVVILLILVGMGVQAWRGNSADEGVWVEGPAGWEEVALDEGPKADLIGGQADGENPSPVPEAAAALPPGGAASAGLIDINRAEATELERLPGIGPARAHAIVEWREGHGGFRSIDELDEIKGIGPSILGRLKPYVTLSPREPARGTKQTIHPIAAADTPPIEIERDAAIVKININRADVEELQSIPGVGPVLAQRIVDRRDAKPFARPEELTEIQGIGDVTLQKMLPWVTVKDDPSIVDDQSAVTEPTKE